MYRIVELSNTFYSFEIDEIKDLQEEEIESIQQFIDNGTSVILVDEVETFEAQFSIKVKRI